MKEVNEASGEASSARWESSTDPFGMKQLTHGECSTIQTLYRVSAGESHGQSVSYAAQTRTVTATEAGRRARQGAALPPEVNNGSVGELYT